jgi:putative phosphonate metabolism protein
MTSPEPHRAAIYFAPDPQQAAERAWWQAGCQWLGRDAASGQICKQLVVPGVDPRLFAELSAQPRRYGWHATLKAPFRLAPGLNLSMLDSAVRSLTKTLSPFGLPPLEVSNMGHFLALRPAQPNSSLQALAAACVTQLQPLAQGLTAEELARRLRAALSTRQTELLQQWGYPWVLDEFRFHCSLTGDLRHATPQQTNNIEQAAREHFADLPPPRIGSLAIFIEPVAGANFVLHRRWPLAGSATA